LHLFGFGEIFSLFHVYPLELSYLVSSSMSFGLRIVSPSLLAKSCYLLRFHHLRFHRQSLSLFPVFLLSICLLLHLLRHLHLVPPVLHPRYFPPYGMAFLPVLLLLELPTMLVLAYQMALMQKEKWFAFFIINAIKNRS